MVYTARNLIADAFSVSKVVAREYQTVSGEQLDTGFRLLNEFLASASISGRKIPYFTEYAFNAVSGQEKYFIPRLIQPQTLTFNIGEVRFVSEYAERSDYFGTYRADNIQSLPYKWHVERSLNGSDLYLYFLPDIAYPLKLWGKFSFPIIEDITEDLSLIFDQSYLGYIKYGLAERICINYGNLFPPEAKALLNEFEEAVTDISPYDLRIKKYSVFQKDDVFNYGDVNIGRGWRPPC